MANIKSSMKRIQISEKLAARNKASRSLMKTNMKKFDSAASEGNRETAVAAYNVAAKTVDRAAAKGLIHKNKAARRKRAMAKQLSNI